MAVWATTDFVGGALGAQVTNLTEPIFSERIGTTLVYAAGINGSPQSAEVQSVSGSLVLNVTGKSHVRVGFDIQRMSGTISSGVLLVTFRSGSTNRADVFLRNAGGGQIALRNNFAYVGQSTRTFANGDLYHIEAEWESGVGFKLYQWHPGNTSATPDEVYTVANTLSVDNIQIGNGSGATGLTLRYATFRATDGEQIRGGVSGGSLVHNEVGAAGTSWFRTVAETSGAATVRAVASLSSSMTSPIYSAYEVPDEYGYSTQTVTGLSPQTQYYWATEVDGVINTTVNGRAKTLPTPNVAANFSFYVGSCHDTVGAAMFANLLARNTDFGFQLGDLGYPYITGGLGDGPNANIAPSDTAAIIAHRKLTIGSALPNALYRGIVFHHTYSDCDGPGGNGDGTWPGIQSGDVQRAYRIQFAHPDLPLADCGARSFVSGRVRFVHTDELTLSSSRSAQDDAAKSKLGATQKAWFFSELLAARDANQVVLWIGDGP